MCVGNHICHWHLKTAATDLPSFFQHSWSLCLVFIPAFNCFPAATEKYGPRLYFLQTDQAQMLRVLPITDRTVGIFAILLLCVNLKFVLFVFSVREEEVSYLC